MASARSSRRSPRQRPEARILSSSCSRQAQLKIWALSCMQSVGRHLGGLLHSGHCVWPGELHVADWKVSAVLTLSRPAVQQASAALEEALQTSDSQRHAATNIAAALVKKPLLDHQDKVTICQAKTQPYLCISAIISVC